jgi:hypothetical protein
MRKDGMQISSWVNVFFLCKVKLGPGNTDICRLEPLFKDPTYSDTPCPVYQPALFSKINLVALYDQVHCAVHLKQTK